MDNMYVSRKELEKMIFRLPPNMQEDVVWFLTHYRVIRAIVGDEPIDRKWLEEKIDELFRIQEEHLALLAIYKLCRDAGASTEDRKTCPE